MLFPLWRVLLIMAVTYLLSKGVVANICDNCLWVKVCVQILVTLLVVNGFVYTAWKKVYMHNPIERDRLLYVKSGGSILYSIIAIVVVVCLIWSVSLVWNIEANEVYSINTEKETEETVSLWWRIVSQFADPGNLMQSAKGGGNVIAFVSAFAGIVCLSGLVVSSLVSMISRRTQQWKSGQIHYTYGFENYVVIVGSNEQTATIIKSSLRNPDVKYVLVQTRKDVEKERSKIELRLEREDEDRVVFYYGDRALEEDIQYLRLEYAKEVYVLGEDMHSENEEDHDAYNMSCLEHIAQYMREHPRMVDKNKQLKCHVNFEYQSTFMAFKSTHIYSSLNKDKIEFLPFNVHEIWAKKVLVDNYSVTPIGRHSEKMVQRYYPLEAYKKKTEYGFDKRLSYIDENSLQTVHLVIVGMNQMGVALAMQAALLVHLPNYQRNNNLRTTITFIDNNAVREGEFLMGRYAALFELCKHRTIVCGRESFSKNDHITDVDNSYNIMWTKNDGRGLDWIDSMEDANGRYHHLGRNFMDLQWEFIEGNVAAKDVQEYLYVLANDTDHRTCTVAVCLNNPQQSIATALYLPEMVLKRALQVLVYQQNSFDMVDKVATSEKEWKRYEKLKPFGMIEGCYTGGIFNGKLAKFANLVYDDSKGELNEQSKINDTRIFQADRLWKELGIVYKLANINLADSFEMRARAIRRDDGTIPQFLKNDERLKLLATAEHIRWLTERLTMGYRPMDEKERIDIKTKHEVRDKEYYKNKSRAHVDICSVEDIKEWDKPAYDKNMDRKILSMVGTMLNWEQQAVLRDLYTGERKDPVVWSIVNDMIETNDGIWMGKHLITARQWYDIMGCLPDGNSLDRGNAPIVNVSKEDVDNFLLVLKNGSRLQFRLPNRGEWENAFVDARKLGLSDMDGLVWQWTGTPCSDYTSGYYFCGKSKNFKDGKWSRNDSYWLPNFKSMDLGLRLVLPYGFRKDDINNPIRDYWVSDDDEHVIDELMSSMVRVPGGAEQKAFYMLPTPVTQRQWKAVMRENNKDVDNPSEHRGDYYPVENVSYKDCLIFIEKLNAKNNKHIEFRLPYDEEWNRAAEYAGASKMKIWHNGITKTTHRVPPILEKNHIYDLYGNVWEWCANSSDGEMPLPNNEQGIVQMLKGGSWRFTQEECLRPEGSYWIPEYRADDVGFRVVTDEVLYKKAFSRDV